MPVGFSQGSIGSSRSGVDGFLSYVPHGGRLPKFHGACVLSESALEMALVVLRQLAVMASVEALDPVALRRRLSTSLPLSVTLALYIILGTGQLTDDLRNKNARSDTHLLSGMFFFVRRLIPLSKRTEL